MVTLPRDYRFYPGTDRNSREHALEAYGSGQCLYCKTTSTADDAQLLTEHTASYQTCNIRSNNVL